MVSLSTGERERPVHDHVPPPHQVARWSSQGRTRQEAVEDLRGHEKGAPPGQNFFIFMQFSGKFGQIVCWRSPLPRVDRSRRMAPTSPSQGPGKHG